VLRSLIATDLRSIRQAMDVAKFKNFNLAIRRMIVKITKISALKVNQLFIYPVVVME